jgi:hypothetical protein
VMEYLEERLFFVLIAYGEWTEVEAQTMAFELKGSLGMAFELKGSLGCISAPMIAAANGHWEWVEPLKLKFSNVMVKTSYDTHWSDSKQSLKSSFKLKKSHFAISFMVEHFLGVLQCVSEKQLLLL